MLSLRGRLETLLNDDDVTPFYLLPALGGGSSLRGYDGWRFRDRNAVLGSAEVRWFPNRLGLDVALFFDTGMVASEVRGLNLNGLKHNFGLGFRFHGPAATPLRIEIARGTEGLQLIFAGGAAF